MSENKDDMLYAALSRQRKRKSITLELKLEILKRLENGERQIDVGRSYNLAGSTVRTIIKNKDRIYLYSQISGHCVQTDGRINQRLPIMHELENELKDWLEQRVTKGLSVKQFDIKNRAKEIYDELKVKYPEYTNVNTFKASTGWLERFKKRLHKYWLNKSEDEYLDYLNSKSRTLQRSADNSEDQNIVVEENVFQDSSTDKDFSQPGCSIWMTGNNGAEELYSENESEYFETVSVTECHENCKPQPEFQVKFKNAEISTIITDDEGVQNDFVTSNTDPKPRSKRPADDSVAPSPKKSQPQPPSSPDHAQKLAEFEAFARSIVTQLTNMPYADAIKLQLKIQMLVTEEKLKTLDSHKSVETKESEIESVNIDIVKHEIEDDDFLPITIKKEPQ